MKMKIKHMGRTIDIDAGIKDVEEDWEKFVEEEGLVDYNRVPVEKARITGWAQAAFWFLRIYILVMIILVIVGFSRIH